MVARGIVCLLEESVCQRDLALGQHLGLLGETHGRPNPGLALSRSKQTLIAKTQTGKASDRRLRQCSLHPSRF